jgi:hypothetical protein
MTYDAVYYVFYPCNVYGKIRESLNPKMRQIFLE